MSNGKSQDKGDRPPSTIGKEPDQDARKAADPEVLKKLPPEVRSLVEVSMARFQGPLPNPLYDKLTPQHISTLLDQSGKDDERKFLDQRSARWFHLGYVILLFALVVFLTYYLVPLNPALYSDIIEKIILVGVGLGGGYGIKAYQDSKRGK